MTDKLAPYNPNDPFDITAERLRVLVCDAAIGVINTRAYKQLTPIKQVEVMLAGITTGMMSVVFACIEPDGRDEITAFVKSYVDQARDQVEGIQFGGGTVQ